MNTKNAFLCFKEFLDMNLIESIIREGFHVVEDDPVYDEYGKAYYEFARGGGSQIAYGEDQHQHQLILLVP